MTREEKLEDALETARGALKAIKQKASVKAMTKHHIMMVAQVALDNTDGLI